MSYVSTITGGEASWLRLGVMKLILPN